MDPQGTTVVYPKDKEDIIRGLRATYERLKAEGKIPAQPASVAQTPQELPTPPAPPVAPIPAVPNDLQSAVADLAEQIDDTPTPADAQPVPEAVPDATLDSMLNTTTPEIAPEATPTPQTKSYDPMTVGVVSTEELNEIKTEAERLRGAIGFQRYMAALNSKDEIDQKYVAAIQAINDVDKGDIKGLYQKYADFIEIAKHMAPDASAQSGYDGQTESAPPAPAPEVVPEEILPSVPDMQAQVPVVPQQMMDIPIAPQEQVSVPSAPRSGSDPYREPVDEVPSPEPIVPPPLPEIPLPPKPEVPEEPMPQPAEISPEETQAEVPQEALASADTPQEAAPDAPPTQQEDPLMHPEVTAGLEQLLSEWDIFASSGIFGFGAGGIEHPTYKKIRELPIATVMSGRWDGASSKVTNNIQTYMDGWRKERGIDAHPEETFETYLRRVVFNILSA